LGLLPRSIAVNGEVFTIRSYVDEAGPAVHYDRAPSKVLIRESSNSWGPELFVRDFTKIEPSYSEEVEDARSRASRSLAGIPEQRKAAGDFAPVQITLDEYESVLLDIKNLDSPNEIPEIQRRIQSVGLIASLKAYQPRVVLASMR
jgi:hypothetical protein